MTASTRQIFARPRTGAKLAAFGSLVFGFLVLGTAINTLRADEQASIDNVHNSHLTQNAVLTIDGLEWRSIVIGAGADHLDAFEATASELETILQRSDNEQLKSDSQLYVDAVRDLLHAIADGDMERATDIDESRVDPAFETVIETANRAADTETAKAAGVAEATARLTWLTMAIFAAVLSVLAHFLFKIPERKYAGFRSLVEGSRDVITVVSGDDEFTTLTPSLGALETEQFDAPTQMSQVLPPDAFKIWNDADINLQRTSQHQEIHIEVQTITGETANLEGRGSCLATEADQRVWIWQDITERIQFERQLRHRAFHDPLTGAANRALFLERVTHALDRSTRTNQPITVLFCDVDNFKAINDSFGHDAGDLYLKATAERMASCIRTGDTLARMGGDEFAVLLESTDPQTATTITNRLSDALSMELDLNGPAITPSLSIGIATSTAGTTAEQLLRDADTAMYASKRSGKGKSTFFGQSPNQSLGGTKKMLNDLRSALANGQFKLHYQPIAEMKTGHVNGLEALLRWDHPEHGLLQADRFIHLTEATGLIVPIGSWVLAQACRDASKLRAQRDTPLRMTVNLSLKQLQSTAILRAVDQALTDSELPPELLVLEVAEGTLLADGSTIDKLRKLRQLGVLISVDDVGTNSTFLKYLPKLPFSGLKIDRSFISGDALSPHDRQVFLRTVINMANDLHIPTTAEGVETMEQLDELTGFGCGIGQGFLWSPAVPIEGALEAIDKISSDSLSNIEQDPTNN